MTPRLGWYGDDFTGATDTLANLARRGKRALLFLRPPSPQDLAEAGPLDALGIAGATRAMTPEDIAQTLEPVGRFFRELGVDVLHYKICSTFDSAPDRGSIGAALAALRPAFPHRCLPILGGQPDLGRYCLFGNLFAAAGTGGAVYRLDRHPTMRAHPVTPMQEADLRAHLAAQGLAPISHLPFTDQGDGLQAAFDAALTTPQQAMLLDVARDEDLAPLGKLLWREAARAPLLAAGASGLAQALAATWPGAAAMAPLPEPPLGPAQGPVLVMVGSLSPISRAQAEAATGFLHLAADPARLLTDAAHREALRAEALRALRDGRHLLVATSPPGSTPPPARDVALATADFLAGLLAEAPVRRLGIAGGDTSSLATQGLDLWGLSYRTTLAPGVTLCRAHSHDPRLDGMELMLKGGQMGPPDLFTRLAA
ncbi:four-carbon acid sugar kinase family protein [Roseomonas sp. 18066]|uniref:four-carbon acid sugar kinase family protein n=1 Tax=Roseomonas sp. 18066 TaxID=2681412 RepID=UPI00135A35D5|nr:four-carbon acid sugar kinase family protein [Roseomonas sp. 18066]